MKKSIISMMVIALMTACTNQETIESVPVLTEQSTVNNNIRSYEDALKIAQSSIAMLESSKASSRGISTGRKIDLNKSKVVTLDNKTRSDAGIKDTLIYVFNFENNEGFVLISASKNTESVLAITEKGYYNPDEPTEPTGFDMFMDLAKLYVSSAPTVEGKGGNRLQKDSIGHSFSDIGPYLTVQWGQRNAYVESELFPNNHAGCANVALSQIMSYYEFPSSIQLTYDNSYTYQSLPWSSMKAHNSGIYHEITWTVCNNTTAHAAIMKLHRQLAEVTQSTILTYETGTNPNNVKPGIQSLGYSVNDNSINIKSELSSQHLIFMYGYTNNGDGHAWVVDGHREDTQTEYILEGTTVGNKILWTIVSQQVLGTYDYYHINWGDNGVSNGYFSAGVYNSANVYWPDSSINYSLGNYTTSITKMSIYH